MLRHAETGGEQRRDTPDRGGQDSGARVLCEEQGRLLGRVASPGPAHFGRRTHVQAHTQCQARHGLGHQVQSDHQRRQVRAERLLHVSDKHTRHQQRAHLQSRRAR